MSSELKLAARRGFFIGVPLGLVVCLVIEILR